ncbi:MAG TPA: glycoside hydrolase family 97 N-terminal domain-containing protein, partial [Bacillota bacterium]|nr:glycoside hydrolase family 97 N-terminal domain-containing protein [Bacillota bacterium]
MRTIFWPVRFAVAVLGVAVCFLAGCTATREQRVAPASNLTVHSPDGKIEVAIVARGALTYAVRVDGQAVVRDSKLGLQMRDGATLGSDVELVRAEQRTVNRTWKNHWGKRRQVREHYNELRLVLRQTSGLNRNFEVLFRAFDDGVGFRYVLPAQSGLETFVL